ncbi:MAG TPA: MazG family protein [Streptosporangiaceae bacterium]
MTEPDEVLGSAVLGSAVLELVKIQDRLRRECPWDARQTHASLAPYLLEETYEALDSLDQGDLAELRGELGDVLLQVVFHARVASERTDGTGFDIDDVARGIAEKLVRRHPHVFGDVQVSGPDEVRRNWDAIKVAERAAAAGDGRPGSALDGVPMAQPALSLAAQLQRRAQAGGVPAEIGELPLAEVSGHDAADQGTATAGDSVSELGAELFALVARARAAGLNPELELRHAARVFGDRVRAWESGQQP